MKLFWLKLEKTLDKGRGKAGRWEGVTPSVAAAGETNLSAATVQSTQVYNNQFLACDFKTARVQIQVYVTIRKGV